MLRTTGMTLAAALLFAGTAWAQDGRAQSRVDRDGDRRVSLAEMQTRAAERFARMDVDRDGRLTREERRAGREAMRAERAALRQSRSGERGGRRAAMLARLDANRDGQLSLAEAPPRLAQRFAQLDADRNGRLTTAELQAGRSQARGHGRGRDGQGRGLDRVRPDANGDGVITLAETQARVSALFAKVDADRDGFLTRDERRARRQERRG